METLIEKSNETNVRVLSRKKGDNRWETMVRPIVMRL